ncbi:type VI secretion system baseplate subunit TssK [Chitinilyticum litopenaei]|uniref:type VI secretion system baseplate subunit TssK n=1 Tax=Chitinilyticum litopenaei TaxID=1121276 RepID=UPI00040B05B3|nr:type VI secretion system baseplate subunit TssK [Chitinilyticum litopenaei]
MNHRVVWSEGLFIQQQHFQQLDRSIDYRLGRLACLSAEWFWGFAELDIDAGLASLGKLALVRAAGVLRDGTVFSFPDALAAPLPLDIPDDIRDEVIYLCLPLVIPGRPTHAYPPALGAARFQVLDRQVEDVFDSQQIVEMALAQEHLQLKLARDVTPEFVCLPVALIAQKLPDGQLLLDAAFLPPVLNCAQPLIRQGQQELLGMFRQRGAMLAAAISGVRSSGAADVTEFLMLQTINRYLPFLEQQLLRPGLAFADFYFACQQIVGDLRVFCPGKRLLDNPPLYDHDRPHLCLAELMVQLRELLTLVIDQSAIRIELQERQLGVRVAIVADATMFTSARFVLAVKAEVASEAVRSRLPSQIKVGPVEKIRELVNLHLPGVPISSLPVTPPQIPFHAGFCYFEFDQSSDFWRPLTTSGGLAMHIAGEFPGIQLELWAIRN